MVFLTVKTQSDHLVIKTCNLCYAQEESVKKVIFRETPVMKTPGRDTFKQSSHSEKDYQTGLRIKNSSIRPNLKLGSSVQDNRSIQQTQSG
jgi:hypothetical protein